MYVGEELRRGDVYIVNFEKCGGVLEPFGIRPAIIVNSTDNEGCRYAQVMVVSSMDKCKPWHVTLKNLKVVSFAMPEQIYTIPKEHIYNRVYTLNREERTNMNFAIIKQIGGLNG